MALCVGIPAAGAIVIARRRFQAPGAIRRTRTSSRKCNAHPVNHGPRLAFRQGPRADQLALFPRLSTIPPNRSVLFSKTCQHHRGTRFSVLIPLTTHRQDTSCWDGKRPGFIRTRAYQFDTNVVTGQCRGEGRRLALCGLQRLYSHRRRATVYWSRETRKSHYKKSLP